MIREVESKETIQNKPGGIGDLNIINHRRLVASKQFQKFVYASDQLPELSKPVFRRFSWSFRDTSGVCNRWRDHLQVVFWTPDRRWRRRGFVQAAD